MAAKLPDPRDIDGRPVHPAASAWYDPANPRAIAYRTDSGEWYGTGGGPHPSMAFAIGWARDESARQWQSSATIAAQAARIREVEAARDGVTACYASALRDLDIRLSELKAAQRDLVHANGLVWRWMATAFVLLGAGTILGYALASVGGGS